MRVRKASNVKQALVFHPTDEEFACPETYISSIREQVEEFGGICKIVPPSSWTPPPIDEAYNLTFSVLTQHTDKVCNGVYRGTFTREEGGSVTKLQDAACDPKYMKSTRLLDMSPSDLGRHFWKDVGSVRPLYGSDVPGTLFREEDTLWNLNKFPSKLYRHNPNIPGVTSSFVYFGLWRSYFAWHKEDLDLASINYLHFGEPKQWYGLAPHAGDKLEKYLKDLLARDFEKCSDYLRHKTVLADPALVSKEVQEPVVSLLQEPGDFVITFPGAYHSGFNTGFNCAEAVNFATDEWLTTKSNDVTRCECRATLNLDFDAIRACA